MKALWKKLWEGRRRRWDEPLPTPEGQVEVTLAMLYGQTKKTFKGAPGQTPEQVAKEFIMEAGRTNIFYLGGGQYELLRDIRSITVKRI